MIELSDVQIAAGIKVLDDRDLSFVRYAWSDPFILDDVSAGDVLRALVIAMTGKRAPLSDCTCRPGRLDDIRHDESCPCRSDASGRK